MMTQTSLTDHVPETETATDGGIDECDECAALPGGVCAQCFIYDGKDWPAPE